MIDELKPQSPYAITKLKEEDYEEWEWAGWQLKFEESHSKGDDLDKKWSHKKKK